MAIDKVIARLDVLNETKSVLDGSATRKDIRLLDARCLREAFLNAMAHNDWVSKVSPTIYVFSDRIEIISIGGLPKGLALEEFYEGCSKPRCPELMRILRDLEYVEQSWFGINKIIETYGKEVFRISENFISVVLPFSKAMISSATKETSKETTKETSKLILEIIKDNPNITAKGIAEAIGLTEDGVRYHINKLKSYGVLERYGSTKKGIWRVIPKGD